MSPRPKTALTKTVTVTQLNEYVNGLLSSDAGLKGLRLSGEVSNFRVTSSGHAYFALKDAESLVRAVMFRSDLANMKFMPEDGMHVIATGHVAVYARDGQYQFYTRSMQLEGEGALYAKFERLKKELSERGWFDADRKRQLPLFPRTVGVVTSPTGAVIHDIENVARRRFPNADILLAPARVQGVGAAEEIARGIDRLCRTGLVDVIIIGRGGGSMEDLWPFNEEVVARAIVESTVPVVSAVGHETDFTIADFAADLRAPTPSAASEMVFPSFDECMDELGSFAFRLKAALFAQTGAKRGELYRVKSRLSALHPRIKLDSDRQRLTALVGRVGTASINAVKLQRAGLKSVGARLDGASPLKTLSRGYAIVQMNGASVRAADIDKGDVLVIRFDDGCADAVVTDKEVR